MTDGKLTCYRFLFIKFSAGCLQSLHESAIPSDVRCTGDSQSQCISLWTSRSFSFRQSWVYNGSKLWNSRPSCSAIHWVQRQWSITSCPSHNSNTISRRQCFFFFLFLEMIHIFLKILFSTHVNLLSKFGIYSPDDSIFLAIILHARLHF